jgi:GTP-binding protein
MIADVGLVGLPNAGKSTFLARVSNARPEIADYPFTTLTPNLGVVDVDDTSVLFADIPGLIEGAAEGKGLGHQFLRHVERTAVILHLIDAYQEDLPGTYRVIRDELAAYDSKLAKRPEIIAINKTEGMDDEMIADMTAQLQAAAGKKAQIFAISGQSGKGLKELMYVIRDAVSAYRHKQATAAERRRTRQPDVPVLRLSEDETSWTVEEVEDGFLISGVKIEQFAARTDYSNEEAVQRLRDIMRKTGIMHELIRRGITGGQTITFPGGRSFKY